MERVDLSSSLSQVVAGLHDSLHETSSSNPALRVSLESGAPR